MHFFLLKKRKYGLPELNCLAIQPTTTAAEIDRLGELNIAVESVLEPVEGPFSSVGRFLQGIQLLRARLDNDQRKEKCTAGMIAKIKMGYWVWRAPYGDENIKDGIVRPTKDAENVKNIFRLRKDGLGLT